MLTSPVGHVGKRERVAFVLNRLPHAGIGRVVVIAQFAERNSATFHTAVIADRRSAVTALRHSSLATGHPNVVISEFNLTVHCSTSAQAKSQVCQNVMEPLLCPPVTASGATT
jgi:hypothetical protein